MPDSLLDAYRAEPESDGHPCPSRDLDPQNSDAAELIRYLANDDLKPLAAPAFAAMADGLGPAERQELLARITSTISNPQVSELLHPDPNKGKRR